MKIFYVSTGLGCTLIKAKDAEQAERLALREVGTYNGVQSVQEATEDDIAWVRAMRGGVLNG